MRSAFPWFTYLLECADGTYYCGITNDLAGRLAAHNAGKGARYTRGRGPCRVVHVERFPSKGDALRREAAIKKLERAAKERLRGCGTSIRWDTASLE